MKNLLHIILVFVLIVMGSLRYHDHNAMIGASEQKFAQCQADTHNHDDQENFHMCFLLRRNQISEYLLFEPIPIKFDKVSSIFSDEKQIFKESHLTSLFRERSPPV